MSEEPGLTARVAGGIDCFFPMLKQSLRIGKCSSFFGRACRRKQENLSADRFWGKLSTFNFWGRIPEGGGFGFHHVTNNKPLQVCQGLPFKASVWSSDSGILSHDKQPVELAVGHVEPISKVGVIACHARQ